ncbi:MAG TPA: hypothetical protein VJV03_09850 [Pyrinomonadaceae bacterium]|nr:hypothetical protein [Pyrinomonadaceae bacterium]
MQRVISGILIVFSLVSPLCSFDVAAQELQQSQSSDTAQAATATPIALKIPDGTVIEVEAPYTYRSMDFKPKDKISFRVVNPIIVEGVTVIEQGATATGRIERAKRGGHWGKAGLLLWTMQSVTARDGSQIPVRPTSIRLRGDSKGAKVATQMIITGALLPFIAPVALLHGFKRGKDAFIPAGKRYSIFVDGDSSVNAAAPATNEANSAP